MPRPRKLKRPRYSEEDLNDIYDKNNGYCWWCGKKLAFTNYGVPGARGAWEVDHSNPVSRGGTNYFRNLVPSCIPCNRSKRDKRRKRYREKSFLEQLFGW